jgi:hypothetical protein
MGKHWRSRGIDDASEWLYKNLLERQGGACICGKPAMPDGETLVLDHSHRTGKARAVLCIPCNLNLGRIEHGKTNAVFNSGWSYFEKREVDPEIVESLID